MVHHIHKDFLKSRQQYSEAEDYWRELWKRLVIEAGATEKWRHPWLGAPLRNGDPIFSAVSPSQRRGIHVIQHEPTSDQLELAWWLDDFGEKGVDVVITQLVISCALSQETADEAYGLIRSWVVRGELGQPDDSVQAPTQSSNDEKWVRDLLEQARYDVKSIINQERAGEKIDRELLILCLR